MQRKLYKELWAMRFEKMLRLEEGGVREYQTLLGELKNKFKEVEARHASPLRINLETLIGDEKKHVKLVQELLTIVSRQVD